MILQVSGLHSESGKTGAGDLVAGELRTAASLRLCVSGRASEPVDGESGLGSPRPSIYPTEPASSACSTLGRAGMGQGSVTAPLHPALLRGQVHTEHRTDSGVVYGRSGREARSQAEGAGARETPLLQPDKARTAAPFPAPSRPAGLCCLVSGPDQVLATLGCKAIRTVRPSALRVAPHNVSLLLFQLPTSTADALPLQPTALSAALLRSTAASEASASITG